MSKSVYNFIQFSYLFRRNKNDWMTKVTKNPDVLIGLSAWKYTSNGIWFSLFLLLFTFPKTKKINFDLLDQCTAVLFGYFTLSKLILNLFSSRSMVFLALIWNNLFLDGKEYIQESFVFRRLNTKMTQQSFVFIPVLIEEK